MTEEGRQETFDRLLQAFLRLDQQALEELAQEGVPVDLRDTDGHTVLLRAAERGATAAVEWILQSGAAVDASSAPEDGSNERTALLLAAEHGHTESAETLLASGAKANRVDGQGASALMLAAHHGHLETVRFLVRSGVDLDLEDDQEHSALTLAQSAGHHDIVALLQALGASGRPHSEDSIPGAATSEKPPATPQIADHEWQTPSTPRVSQTRPLHGVSPAHSTGDLTSDLIQDQISDWIDDDVIDL